MQPLEAKQQQGTPKRRPDVNDDDGNDDRRVFFGQQRSGEALDDAAESSPLAGLQEQELANGLRQGEAAIRVAGDAAGQRLHLRGRIEASQTEPVESRGQDEHRILVVQGPYPGAAAAAAAADQLQGDRRAPHEQTRDPR